MKRKNNRITDEQKRRYVEMYKTSSYTLREVAQMAGVAHQTIWCWVNNGTTSKRISRYNDVKKPNPPRAIDPRDAEIARLKAALEKAELRAHALDTMIDVAEAKLNISIRKKAGAKQ